VTAYRVTFSIRGMDCAACARHVENRLRAIDGVSDATVDAVTEHCIVLCDGAAVSEADLYAAVRELGYHPAATLEPRRHPIRRQEQRLLLRIGLAAVLLPLAWKGPEATSTPLAIAATIVTGYSILWQAGRSVRRRAMDVETFLSLGIVACCAVGEFLAAATIGVFVLVAQVLEIHTSDRSRRGIRELVAATPHSALVRRGGDVARIPADQLTCGDTVLVRPGTRIPADGHVLSGQAAVNEAPITGESTPKEKGPGDRVFAGSITDAGALEIHVDRVGRETTLGRIITMVEEAQERKAPVQRLADRFATYFTPAVLAAAAGAYLWTDDVLAAVSVIVVACPCAVALATPLAVVAAVGNAARRGILVKGGAHLEALARADAFVFDKTGTLTTGRPEVLAVASFDGHTEREILSAAAMVERFSEHPLARAIRRRAAECGLPPIEPSGFTPVPGRGVIATDPVSGSMIVVGTADLLRDHGAELSPDAERRVQTEEARGASVLLVAHDGVPCGYVAVRDQLRPEAASALASLTRLGIRRLVMMTGDGNGAAQAVARELPLSFSHSNLLPGDKTALVRELGQTHRVAMVGDGINDAPALAEAHVGIAMGAAGTDAAIEAADVALMTDDLRRIPEAVALGRQAVATIRRNLVIALAFNIAGVALAASGVLPPAAAAATHVLPDVGVFLNSARLLYWAGLPEAEDN